MVKIEEIASTLTFAWSNDTLPLLATGTVAGAIDVNFTLLLVLEIYDIFTSSKSTEPVFTASVDARFYALAWSKPFDNREQGLIAGAYEDGLIEFWDAAVLIKTKDLKKASVHKLTKHTSGPAKAIAFNPLKPQILVLGGAKGQLFVWNCVGFDEPTTPGTAMTPMDEITSVAWNNTVPHIFALTGNLGYTLVWDLKAKREVLHLQYQSQTGARANFSQVAWHPTQLTKLVTASDLDACPLIMTWDLRNSNAPEQVLSGHKKGVLLVDWCRQDPSLLLLSGKDNTTLLWNPLTATKLGEYPTTANWTFHVRFAPRSPDIFAMALFDGKVIVQTLQDTTPPVLAAVAAALTAGGDDAFWSQISTTETQQPKFDVLQAPQWLKCPCSASFGFGNKLAIVTTTNGKLTVEVKRFASGASSGEAFKLALALGLFGEIIASKTEQKTTEADSGDWKLLEKLSGDNQHYKKQFTATDEKENSDTKEDSFFDHLEESVSYVPEGEFELGDSELVKLALSNKRAAAVQYCLDHGKLEEALLLVLDPKSSEALREKVRNAYFNKNKASTELRVLYSVTRGDVGDIVAHADTKNWEDIGKAITAFANDPAQYNTQMAHLGGRIKNRDHALSVLAAGENLDKIAAIWLADMPAFEEKLLSGSDSKISSPADARYATLDNFVQKIATYRQVSGAQAPQITDEGVIKAILEYCLMVAAAGEFELAEQFLPLLPDEVAQLEKDRISKATSKPQANTNSAASVGGGRYGARAATQPNAQPKQPTQTAQASRIPPTPAANPSFSTVPPVAPGFPPAPSFTPQPANPTPAAATRANPYARSNPYAPQQAQQPVQPAPVANPYAAPPPIGGVTSPGPQFMLMNATPPPPKKKEEGWNDLPDGIQIGSKPRRAAAAATVTPTPQAFGPTGSQAPPFQGPNAAPPPGPSRKASQANGMTAPPPPKSSNHGLATNSPRPGHAGTQSKYAPPPGSVAPPTPQFEAPPTRSSQSPAKGPPKNPYAPQSVQVPPPMGSVPPSTSFAAPPAAATGAPPKNPYAPPPGAQPMAPMPSGPSAAGAFAPPPMSVVSGFAPPPVAPVGPPPMAAPPMGAPPIGAPPMGGPIQSAPPLASQSQSPALQSALPVPATSKYPPGDRSHIPEGSKPVYETLLKIHEAIKPKIPERFAKHGVDMNKRLNILYDHLNNDDLLSEAAIGELKKICDALEAKDFATASSLNLALATNHSDEMGHWNTGVKRLITMAEVMYE